MNAKAAIKILVVDDNDELRDVITLALRNAGYNVTEAHNGAEALKYLATSEFKLMLIDIMMPRINGLEVLQKLETVDHPIPAIIMMSQIPHIEAAIANFKLSNISYLSKPFESDTLLLKVARTLADKPE